VDPATFYDTVWTATYGSEIGFSSVLLLATPLLLAAMAACIPYQLRLWNIGADGQMYIGAWVAAGLAVSVAGDLSGPLLIALMLAGSALGGCLWILVPALARAYLGVNEIFTTLMLNFIGLYWVLYWATGPWQSSVSAGGVQSEPLPEKTHLPTLMLGDLTIPIGLVGGAVIAVLLWVYFRKSKFGYEISILRSAEGAAEYAGIPVKRRIMGVMLIGGVLAGFAGAVEMMGNTFQYSPAISVNTGYTGIVVAILAAGSTLGAVPVAVLFASVLAGGNALSLVGVESDMIVAVLGITLLIAAIGDGAARWKLVRRDKEPEDKRPSATAKGEATTGDSVGAVR
jgi:simple sugar transport system permease protein